MATKQELQAQIDALQASLATAKATQTSTEHSLQVARQPIVGDFVPPSPQVQTLGTPMHSFAAEEVEELVKNRANKAAAKKAKASANNAVTDGFNFLVTRFGLVPAIGISLLLGMVGEAKIDLIEPDFGVQPTVVDFLLK